MFVSDENFIFCSESAMSGKRFISVDILYGAFARATDSHLNNFYIFEQKKYKSTSN